MTHVIRATTAADMLAAVDMRLGYRPTDSLAVAFIRDRSVGLVMRLDLRDVPEALGTITHHAGREHATHAIVITYSDAETRDVVAQVTDALATSAVTVGRTIRVATDGYRDGHQADPEPLDQITTSPVAARFVYEGHTVAASRAEILPQPATQAAQDAATAAAAQWAAETDTEASFGIAAWMVALEDLASGPHIWGTLGAALRIRSVRDAVLVAVVPGTPDDAPLQVACNPSGAHEAAEAAVQAVFLPGAAACEPAERAQRATQVLAQVISHDPQNEAAWTLWAVLTWWGGNAAIAGDAIERALQIDPDHRLAALLAHVITQGIAPGWVESTRR